MTGVSCRRRAVVLGASVGGLCAAEALASSFEEVLLLERDQLADDARPRRGVPQGAQPHALQMRGRGELEALFPGVLETLRQRGAFEFDPFQHVARLTPHGWAPRYDDLGGTALAASRPLFELTLRQALLARRTNVRIAERVKVTGLTHRRHADQLWITGVLTDSPDPSLSRIPADLVVDATGRGTKAPKWLGELGLPPPVELRVDASCNYATRHYRAPAEAKSWWWRTLLIDQRPPDQARGCAIFTVEAECWIVTAIGTNGDFAPSDEAGWLDFLKSLRSPVAHDLVRRAEPLGDIVQSRTTVNRWKRMHEYEAKLGGLLLFGDAVCGFNPSYGQGITASLLAARTLAEMMPLHAGPIDHVFLRRYYEAQAGFLKAGWALSTNMDFRWPTTTGKRPMFYPLVRKAAALLERIAVHDPELLRALIPLADFGASPWSVVSPSLCARIVRGLARHVIARPQLAAEVDLFSSATSASDPSALAAFTLRGL